jgi:hypothetical protein
MNSIEFEAARQFADTPAGRIAYVEKGNGPVAYFCTADCSTAIFGVISFKSWATFVGVLRLISWLMALRSAKPARTFHTTARRQ